MTGARLNTPCMTVARLVLAAVALGAPLHGFATQSPQARDEIDALISGLGRSGCEFERNGEWYRAAKAEAHLRKKYDYLRKRGLADTAEWFIERAASRSSVSGKPYRVRCPGRPVEPSAAWFERMLRQWRAKPPSTR